MKFTEGNVLKTKHQVIRDATFDWNPPSAEADEKQMAHILSYIRGVNDMAQAVLENMEAISRM